MTPLLLILSALETSALILAAINCPGYTLAAIGILFACGLIAAGWWLVECAIEGRKHDAEHDLP